MKSSPLNDINNADQHRVMDVRVNQSRSGVRMLPWVGESGERNPGIELAKCSEPVKRATDLAMEFSCFHEMSSF